VKDVKDEFAILHHDLSPFTGLYTICCKGGERCEGKKTKKHWGVLPFGTQTSYLCAKTAVRDICSFFISILLYIT
jgi:hypothetical protein